MEQIELYEMIKLFIKENKENEKQNTDEHKEIFKCLKTIESKLSATTTAQQNIIDNNEKCDKTLDDLESTLSTITTAQQKIIDTKDESDRILDDHENRLREVESLKRLKELPDRVDKLARQVYGVGGAMAVIMLIASWILKSQGG